jgi:tetratricopeptide (TPR) repeat protein
MAAGKKKVAKTKKNAYELYEEAVQQVHGGRYERALKTLERIGHEFPDELDLLDRARVFRRICRRRLGTGAEKQATEPVPNYDLGVVHHNNGDYTEALGCFKKALEEGQDETDHIHYAIAATMSRQKEIEQATKHLRKAIELRRENRFFASNDPDFAPLIQREEVKALFVQDE